MIQLDQHLVVKLQKGDPHSLKQVVKNSLNSLYRISYKITGDSEESREILRRVYKQIWQHREDLDLYRQLGPLLTREVYLQSMKAKDGDPNIEPALNQLKEKGDERAAYVANNLNQANKLDSLLFLLFFVDGFDFRDLALMAKIEEPEISQRIGSVMTTLGGVHAA